MAYKASLYQPRWFSNLLEQQDKVQDAADAYVMVPLIWRAVQLRCNALTRVPVHVYDGDREVEWPYGDLSSLLWRTEAALLLSGAAYWLRLRKGRILRGFQWLNPLTMEVRWDEENERLEFTQQVNGQTYGPWYEEDMAYFREFDIRDDLLPTGVSAASVALPNAQVIYYVTQFAWQFFENGAMPVMLVGVESPSGVLNPDDRKRIEGFFKRVASGVKNAWRVIALGTSVKPQIVTPPLKDLALENVMSEARRQVALAFGIPQTMLEDAANYATAVEHRRSFWSETVMPRARLIEETINSQALAGTRLRIRFAFEEMDIFQEDEQARAAAFATYVQAGIRPSVAAQMLGLELPEGMDYGDLDTYGVPTQQGPAEMPALPAVEETPMRADLRAWRRKALKRVKAGKSPAVDFVSEHIPPSLAGAIRGALSACESADDVRRVFDMLDDAVEEYP